jgi:hypothetical protein
LPQETVMYFSLVMKLARRISIDIIGFNQI